MAEVIGFEIKIPGAKDLEVVLKNQEEFKNLIKETKNELKGEPFGTDKYNQLNQRLGALQANQQKLRKETTLTKNEMIAQGVSGASAYDRLSARLNVLRSNYKNAQASVVILTEKMDKLNAEGKQNTQEFKELDKELKKTTQSIKVMTPQVDKLDKSLKDIDGRSGQFQRNVGNYPKVFNSARASLLSLTSAVGLGLGLSGLTSLVKSSTAAFVTQEAAIKKVEQALKSTEGASGKTLSELKKQALDLQDVTLFGDEEILNKATAQLLTFTNIANKEFDRTQKVALDLATVLDGDLQSSSIQLGKALNDPIANLSALSESGIQFSQEQKDVIKELASTNRLAEAQGVILKELERQYGGQAEAAAKGAGAIKQFQNRIGDVKEEIGQAVSELITARKEGIDKLITSLGNLTRLLIQNIDLIPKIAIGIGLIVSRTKIATVVQAAYTAVLGLGSTALGILTGKINLATIAQNLFNKATKANPIGAVITIVTSAYLAYEIFSRNLGEAARQQREVNEAILQTNVEIKKQQTAVSDNIKVLKDANATEEERKKAIDSLNNSYPELLKNINLNTANTTELEAIESKLNDTIQQRLVSQKRASLIDAERNKIIEAQLRLAQLETAGTGAFSIITDKELKRAGLARGVFRGLVVESEAIARVTRRLREDIEKGNNAIESFDKGFEKAFGFNSKNEIDQLKKSLIGANLELTSSVATITRIQELQTGIKGTAQSFEEIKAEIEGVGNAAKDAATATGAVVASGNKNTKAIKEQKDEVSKFKKELEGLISVLENDTGVDQAGVDLLKRSRAEIEALENLFSRIENQTSRIKRETGGIATRINPRFSLDEEDDDNFSALQNRLNIERSQRISAEAETIKDIERINKEFRVRELKAQLDSLILGKEQRLQIEEEINKIQLELLGENIAARFEGALSFAQQGIDLLGQFFETATDKRIDDLERQREAELSNENLTEEQKEKINKKFDDRKRKLEKQAFERQKALSIASALINGALAITSTLAAIPGPLDILSLGAARIAQLAFVGATTAAQIAAIAASKFAGGGFTGVGLNYRDETGQRVAGVVHENEYVAPTKQIKKYPRLFRMLESDRLGSYASGGFTSPSAIPSGAIDNSISRGVLVVSIDSKMIAKDITDSIKEGLKDFADLPENIEKSVGNAIETAFEDKTETVASNNNNV